MPQKRSTYGGIITTHTETDVQEPQAATTTAQQQEEQNTAAEETQPEENGTPEVNTPLSTTPIQCSTSHDPCPSKKDDDKQTTPIRATGTAGTPAETERANKEKGKTDNKEIKQKNNKVTFEESSDLRRSDWIKGARRTEKLSGVEYYLYWSFGNHLHPTSKIPYNSFPRLKKENPQAGQSDKKPSGNQDWFP